MKQSEFCRHCVFIFEVSGRQGVCTFAHAASIVLFTDVDSIVGVHEGLAFDTTRRIFGQNRILILVEDGVVESLRDDGFGLKVLAGSEGVPDESDRIPLLLLLNLHLYYHTWSSAGDRTVRSDMIH
jgi:hypothetical protein